MICAACLFTMLTKSKAFIPFFFCPRVELCWNARLTRTSGMALHFETLVVATLLLCNSTAKSLQSMNSLQNGH